MAEKLTLVCDRKAGTKACTNPAESYLIRLPDQSAIRVDLCEQHSDLLIQPLVDIGTVTAARKGQRSTFKKTQLKIK
jgi:hypothetical protein